MSHYDEQYDEEYARKRRRDSEMLLERRKNYPEKAQMALDFREMKEAYDWYYRGTSTC